MKKLLSLLAATGLVATTSATVVACGDKAPDKSSVSFLDNLKAKVKEIAEKGYLSGDLALTAINSDVKADHDKGIFVGDESPTAVKQVLFVKAELETNNTSLKITYKESKADSSDSSKFVWGDEATFTQAITIVTPSITANKTATVQTGNSVDVAYSIENPKPNTVLTATSANPDVATVTVGEDKVTIKSVGKEAATVDITLKYEGATDFVIIVTIQEEAVSPEITAPGKQTVVEGKEGSVNVTVNHETTETLKADSSDTTIATVSVDGKKVTFKGIKAGTATITLSYTGAESVTFEVEVTPVASIAKIDDQTVKAGANGSVNVTINNGGNGTLSATSASTEVATVSVSGTTINYTGVKAGESVVTVKYTDAQDVTFKITVSAADPIIGNVSNQTVKAGESVNVNVSITNKVEGKTLTATSLDESIATTSVNGDVVTVTGEKAGSVKITLKYDGATEVSFDVQVTPKDPTIADVSDQTVKVEETIDVAVSIENKVGGTNLQATSKDESLATVTVDGDTVKVTGVAEGEVTITLNYGSVSKEFKVTVEPKGE
ncbi:hypothetical protein SCHIN_v1c07140 [Spiroplasma chinense]|uniref:BIG2 domain-containing protein n=1 Tax=Spiroplasma chinense TaxID=216932 RepID=A0A5B9Y5D8_9MOLU|nr:lipoprotein [Spiroplasma chinense]QEH61909.1 hypothetical protein SCHIN_v1c07140 [Spiroplasma chinense]